MDETVKVDHVQVSIRRDAYTTTDTAVLRHELPVLRLVHGKDNIVEMDAVGVSEVDPEREYSRLCDEYGFDNVSKVYGQDEGFALAEKLRNPVVKETKKTAKA